MKFSSNIENLGTENAFKVSTDPNSLLINGGKIFSFHVGDNLEKFRINALKNTGVAFLTRNHFGSLNERQDENLFYFNIFRY